MTTANVLLLQNSTLSALLRLSQDALLDGLQQEAHRATMRVRTDPTIITRSHAL